MQNRFGLKDFFTMALLVVVIIMLGLVMLQRDRSFEKSREVQIATDDLKTMLATLMTGTEETNARLGSLAGTSKRQADNTDALLAEMCEGRPVSRVAADVGLSRQEVHRRIARARDQFLPHAAVQKHDIRHLALHPCAVPALTDDNRPVKSGLTGVMAWERLRRTCREAPWTTRLCPLRTLARP